MKGNPLLRWALVALVCAGGGALLYLGVDGVVRWLGPRASNWEVILLGLYGCMFAGYVFSALVTRLAPRRRYPVAVLTVCVTVVVAAFLGLADDDRSLEAMILAIGLVLGAAGHAIRRRGFTDSVSTARV